MTVIDTEKGELCTIELYLDEDYDERYFDGDIDTFWIDRFHGESYDTIEDFIVEHLQLNDVNEKVFINMNACRSSTIVMDPEYDQGFYIEEIGDSCLGGEEYVWDGNILSERTFTLE